MRKFDAVIFDLDGTLLNTLDDLADSCNIALSHFGYPKRTLDEVRCFVGNGLGELINKALPEGRANKDYDSVLAFMRKIYAANWNVKTTAYKGIIELLEGLAAKNVKMGIVSNKPDAQVKELANVFFDCRIEEKNAVGENEAKGIKRKPAPDSVFEVMKNLGVKKTRAVYVGDSDVDILTANAAGIPCISVCWGFRSKDFLIEHGATCLVEKPDEIFSIIGVD